MRACRLKEPIMTKAPKIDVAKKAAAITATRAVAASVTGSDHVVIFDTTLRDGEQCPGATMKIGRAHV